MPIRSPRQQYDVFMALMQGRSLERSSVTFGAALDWINKYPKDFTEDEIRDLRKEICRCYGVSESELMSALVSSNGHDPLWTPETAINRAVVEEREFDQLVPPDGFFRSYVEYTRDTESPMTFNFFAAAAGLAAVVNRRCWRPLGVSHPIYPPMGFILLGDSGVRKTLACDMMTDMLKETGLVHVYAERITPEALELDMSKGQANGLVYAPEMTTLISRVQYQSHIAIILTRLLDSPLFYPVSTISRGEQMLKDVCITTLMASTVKLFIDNTPPEMFSSGFIPRHLLVYQKEAPKAIAFPQDADVGLKNKCIQQMIEAHEWSGEMQFRSVTAAARYKEFYDTVKYNPMEHEILEPYRNRKPAHTIRLAMLLHISRHEGLDICYDCLERAIGLIEFIERSYSSLLRKMFRRAVGEDGDIVLRHIRRAGEISRTDLMRKVCSKMDSPRLNSIVNTLKEAGLITESIVKLTKGANKCIYTAKEEQDDE